MKGGKETEENKERLIRTHSGVLLLAFVPKFFGEDQVENRKKTE